MVQAVDLWDATMRPVVRGLTGAGWASPFSRLRCVRERTFGNELPIALPDELARAGRCLNVR